MQTPETEALCVNRFSVKNHCFTLTLYTTSPKPEKMCYQTEQRNDYLNITPKESHILKVITHKLLKCHLWWSPQVWRTNQKNICWDRLNERCKVSFQWTSKVRTSYFWWQGRPDKEFWPGRTPSEEIGRWCWLEQLNIEIRKGRLRWLGHVKKREVGDCLGDVLQIEVPGNRPRGRPKKSWMDNLKEYLRKLNLREDDAYNRDYWRAVMKRLTP